MSLQNKIATAVSEASLKLYGQSIDANAIKVEVTNKDHKGDYTVVVFPLLKISKKNPEQTANDIGGYLQEHLDFISGFNVVKGFLNLELSATFWLDFLEKEYRNESFGKGEATNKTVVVEYCGPNTNKPLHLGHVRNMLLGWSLSQILEFAGNKVVKVNIYNDRGIAICKSMVAWKRKGNGETPESSGMKGDHLVGKYYVEYDRILKSEIEDLIQKGIAKEEAEKKTSVYLEAVDTLRKWEGGDKETLSLWKTMNDWVYEGFYESYKKIGVAFDKNYYESETYLLGKEIVEEGLANGAFYKKEDGSSWVNLTDKGLDEKVLLRSDGTSVYLTQDLGTAQLRYEDFKMDKSIYVVANEQDYHFKVLQLTLEKLGKPYAAGIYHLSYGMVDLPSGKMKSREGTVVDADELINDMLETAAQHTKELGKIDDFSIEEAKELYRTIGLGALKFFILRVDPKKRMLFNPQESIDFHGQTGPFVQYTHARIQSILRKEKATGSIPKDYQLNEQEKEMIAQLFLFPSVADDAARNYDPSAISTYTYTLAKTYNGFYHDCPILKAETPEDAKHVRLAISQLTGLVLKTGLRLLGINAPEKM
jgi:arginyl-tRNA synthetase